MAVPPGYRGEVKIALYPGLALTTREHGAIRFIPGSHRDPMNAELHATGFIAEARQWNGRD